MSARPPLFPPKEKLAVKRDLGKPTARQQQVLDYITESVAQRGYPPTIREIATHIGIRSTNGANDHLRALERKGLLTRDKAQARGMRATGQRMAEMAEVPESKLRELWAACERWIERTEASCPESVYQCDSVNLACLLAEEVGEIVGWHRVDDEDDAP